MKPTQQIIKLIESEWNIDSGFFGKLRQGLYDGEGYARVLEILKEVDLGDTRLLDRRLVSLLWYIPLFMLWQHERVVEKSGDIVGFRQASDLIEAQIERILGVP